MEYLILWPAVAGTWFSSLPRISGVVAVNYDSGATAYSPSGNGSGGYWTSSANADGKNYSRTWYNPFGQGYSTEQKGLSTAGASRSVFSTVGFDNLGRPIKQVGFDGATTLIGYDASTGEVSSIVTDVNRSGSYDAGTDRKTVFASTSLPQNALGGPYDVRRSYAITLGSRPSVSIGESSFDGKFSWQSDNGIEKADQVKRLCGHRVRFQKPVSGTRMATTPTPSVAPAPGTPRTPRRTAPSASLPQRESLRR